MKYFIEKVNLQKMMNRLEGKPGEDYAIKIPPYQRDCVWNDSDVEDILFSLRNGYPIGAITMTKFSANGENEKDHYELLDGLQRHTSIRKIQLNPANYVKIKLIENELKNEGIQLSDSDKEIFKTNYSKIINDEDFNGIVSVDDLSEISSGMSKSEDVIRVVNNITNWIMGDMLQEILVPHIVIHEFEQGESQRAFTLINKKGKKLTTFESNSAQWSLKKIDLSDENEVISDFHRKRTKSYYKTMNIKSSSKEGDSENKYLNDYENQSVLPSNFMLATFGHAISDFPNFESLFFKNGKLIEGSIEPMVNIIKYLTYGIKEEHLQLGVAEFGEVLSDYYGGDPKKTDKLINQMKKSFLDLKKNAKVLSAIKSNSHGKYSMKLPSAWLFAVLVIHMNWCDKENKSFDKINQWIVYEILKEKNYSKGTKTYAKKILDNKTYFNDVDEIFNDTTQTLSNWMQIKINNEQFNKESDRSISKFAKITLGLIQSEYIHIDETDLDIDHLIPQKTMKQFSGLNMHSIFNLSLLNKTQNREEKNAFLESDTLHKYDFVYKHLIEDSKEKQSYLNQFELVRRSSYAFEIDSDGKTIKTDKGNGKKRQSNPIEKPLKDFIALRKKYILNAIKNKITDFN